MTDIFENMVAFAGKLPEGEQLHEFLDRMINEGDESALHLVAERVTHLTDQDRSRAAAYTEFGYYVDLSEDERLAAWMLALEMRRMRELDLLRARFGRYSPQQVLFHSLPGLLEQARDSELLPFQPARRVRHDRVIHWDGVFVRLDPFLAPVLVTSLSAAFPKAPLFVRLDPGFASANNPREYLVEEVLVPADPNWWQSLGIHRGETKGSHYAIQDTKEPTINLQSYLDYWVRGVRTLEVHAQRTKVDYLSMMVEELVDLRESSGILLGRCIHWDTDALMGTPPEAAQVKHLDLAINVYCGKAAEQRLSESLVGGHVTDATFRTHLLRIEEVPAKALLAIAAHFFVSSVLLSEWIKDQFRWPE